MRLPKLFTACALAIACALPASSQSPVSIQPLPSAREAAAITTPPPRPTRSTPVLNRPDLEAWLDGFMPFALARSDIAGAVVVVVKDGQVLLEKGYGLADVAGRQPVDPQRTLFRPGSVSKLLTWTAVMQLVQQGKLDLDRDINAYLDFKVPAYEGQPITLRNIMTHTSGFEESARFTLTGQPMALGPLMKDTLPRRIFAPGKTPAYSNYATALAGYIVQRRSGMPFDEYIERNIFQPLGMAHSSFRQPLPPALGSSLSKAYELASGDPQPFEFVGPAPAGSLSATGSDMGKFMIAHLADGGPLLRPATARMMHGTTLPILPPLHRMALGFYQEDINGQRVIGHGGDTQLFHSNLSLFLDQNVGLFVSLNSAGANGASRPLRNALFQGFANRYFPGPAEPTVAGVDAETAKQHVRMMAGTYANSRGFKTNFLSILNLLQPTTMGVSPDGSLSATSVTGLASQPRRWIEVAPFVWRDLGSGDRIAAQVTNGRVTRWSFDEVSPFMMFDRVPWQLDSAWLLPVFMIGLAIVAIAAITWPAGAIARRRYGAAQPFEGRRLLIQRLTHGFAWGVLLVLAGWMTYVTVGFANLPLLGGPLDPLLWLLQILSPIVFVGLFALCAWMAWKERRGWFAKLWSVLLLLGSLAVLWVALGFHLIGFGTNF